MNLSENATNCWEDTAPLQVIMLTCLDVQYGLDVIQVRLECSYLAGDQVERPHHHLLPHRHLQHAHPRCHPLSQTEGASTTVQKTASEMQVAPRILRLKYYCKKCRKFCHRLP